MKVTLRDNKTAVEFSEACFGAKFNEPLVHQVVVACLAARRAGTKAQKTRAEVRGGGRKPWRQKGTGHHDTEKTMNRNAETIITHIREGKKNTVTTIEITSNGSAHITLESLSAITLSLWPKVVSVNASLTMTARLFSMT